MKKLLFIFGLLIICAKLTAQIPQIGNNDHVKLADIVAQYKLMNPGYGEPNYAKALLPGLKMEASEKYFLFDRWRWYWQQHLDNDGYLVSVAQTWQEWQKAREAERSAARTTSGISSSWTFAGPDSSEAYGEGVGRINLVAFDPVDTYTYWVGTPGGGAWKSSNNGRSWTNMTASLPVLSVSDIEFNPKNHNTIYLCTGDRDAGDYSGIGLLKSYDGGNTWLNTGMTWTASQNYVANSMVVNPQDTNSIIVATTQGIYTSYNGGATFTLTQAGDYKQILYRPGDTSILYATTYETSSPAQIWRSLNAAITWTQQTNIPADVRLTLAVTPAAPNMVLAIGAADYTSSNALGLDGIYKSSDTGDVFTEIYTGGCVGNLLAWDPGGSECGGQGWYTLPLAISPVDSNIVYTGGVNTWMSTNGGFAWTLANQESPSFVTAAVIHADKHWLAFNPLLPSRLFETNDGGVYFSDNPTATGVWNNITNRMGIEEIYRLGVSNVASFTITGAQDDGSKVETAAGIYEEANGGDGMTCQLNIADSTVAYASSEYGYINILDPTSSDPIGTAYDISVNIGGAEGTGDWVTPFVMVPSCSFCILAGYNTLYESNNEGASWSAISGQLTTNNLYRIATSLSSPNTIYATEDYGSNAIHYTHNGGTTWSVMYAHPNISDITVDPTDSSHIYITYSGYGGPEVEQYRPSTGFQYLTTGLPNVPVYCIAFDYLSRDIYVGTEIGVYYMDSTMTSWAPYTTGLPSVQVTDLAINYTTNVLWASTYGRSLWKSPKHTATVLPTAVQSIVPYAADGMAISPNPNYGNFTVTTRNMANTEVTLHIIDADGKDVWQTTGNMTGNKLSVQTHGIVPGNYIVELVSEGRVAGKQRVTIL